MGLLNRHILPWRLLLCGMACAALIASCTTFRVDRPLTVAQDDWPMLGRTPGHRNETQAAMLSLPLRPVWTYAVPAGIGAQPLVRDSVVFLVTVQGDVHALRITDGGGIGVLSVKSPVTATPVLTDSILIVAAAMVPGGITAWDMHTGDRLWRSPPAVSDAALNLSAGRLFAALADGSLRCFDAGDGRERWSMRIAPEEGHRTLRSAPAVDTACVFLAADDGSVYAFRIPDGSIAWSRDVGGGILAAPLLVEGALVVATLRGTVLALEASTGVPRWSVETSAPVYAAPATNGRWVFVGSSDGRVAAYDAATGALHWCATLPSPVGSAPLVVDSILVVGLLDRSVRALSVGDGSEVWHTSAEGRVRVPPVGWRGTLLVVTDDRTLTAYRGGKP